jgi:hypothetical protein
MFVPVIVSLPLSVWPMASLAQQKAPVPDAQAEQTAKTSAGELFGSRFASFSLISFLAAVRAWKREPSSKWLALLNVPGLIVFGWFFVMPAIEGLTGD